MALCKGDDRRASVLFVEAVSRRQKSVAQMGAAKCQTLRIRQRPYRREDDGAFSFFTHYDKRHERARHPAWRQTSPHPVRLFDGQMNYLRLTLVATAAPRMIRMAASR